MRDTQLKPRETEKRSPEELRKVLAKIYPEEIVDELMKNLGMMEDEEKNEIESYA